MADSKLYAVIHSASKNLSLKTIEEEFVAEFKFGREDKCISLLMLIQ